MTTTMPSRTQIDQAEPLDFPDRKPARQDLTITIAVCVNGFNAEVCFSGQLDQLEILTRRLRDLGMSPAGVHQVSPASTPAEIHTPARKGAAMITTPAYDGSGQALCPVHRKALVEGKYGLYCPSKAEGEHANSKGWCNIRFTD